MIDLKGQPGELRFTLTIKRAATGKEETVEMVGRIGDAPPVNEEPHHGSDPLDSGT